MKSQMWDVIYRGITIHRIELVNNSYEHCQWVLEEVSWETKYGLPDAMRLIDERLNRWNY